MYSHQMVQAANLAVASLPCKVQCPKRKISSQCFHPSKNGSHSGNDSRDALAAIQDSGVIACLRAQSAELAFEAASAALDGGVTVLELVVSNPGAFEVLDKLVQYYPTKTLGVGTVLDVEDAKTAITFGAKFLLSPAMVNGILDNASFDGTLFVPGAMTPTEILSTYNAGARLIKVYPVSAMGGISFIATLKKVFPQIPLVASQGINLDSVEEYLAEGATAVVLSDAIFNKKAMAERNFEAIYQLSQSAVLQAVKGLERYEWLEQLGIPAGV